MPVPLTHIHVHAHVHAHIHIFCSDFDTICPARSSHTTETVTKRQCLNDRGEDNDKPMNSVNFNTCVNFELRPGSGDIHICCFNFDDLAQGNAYNSQRSREIAVHHARIDLIPFILWDNIASCQLSSTFVPCHRYCPPGIISTPVLILNYARALATIILTQIPIPYTHTPTHTHKHTYTHIHNHTSIHM